VSSELVIPTPQVSETAESSQSPITFGTANTNNSFSQTTPPNPWFTQSTTESFSNPTATPLINYNTIASESARPIDTTYLSKPNQTDIQSRFAAFINSPEAKDLELLQKALQPIFELPHPAQKHSRGSRGKKATSRRPKQKKKREEWVEYDDW
jgi:hypothetical protein